MKRILQTIAGTEKENKPDRQEEFFGPSGILLIAVWCGLLTGLMEAVYLFGWRLNVKGYRLHLNSPHVLWMAPLAELIIFVFLGGILALLAWRAPRFFTGRAIVFFLALFSFLALFLTLPQLHVYAKWLLSVGLAVQTARFVVKRQDGFYRLVRRTSIWLAAVVGVLALGAFIWETAAEQNALAKLPPGTPALPNVLLITLDTVRAGNLSVYGYERRTTPQLEKLVTEGAVFEQAIATSSWTLPSHASIFTGRHPHEFSKVGWQGYLGGTYRTLAEELSSRGYESAGFAANYIYCSREVKVNRGMVRYEDYPVSIGQTVLSGSLTRALSETGFIRRALGYHQHLNVKRAETLNEDFFDWLSSRDRQRPFFVFLNYFDAHEPLLPPPPFDGMFGPTQPDGNYHYETNLIGLTDKQSWSEQDALKFRNAYDSSIAYLDDQLGKLFARLSEKGLLDNTLVIVTSDHGELLGEKELFGHGTSLYAETLKVPLLIRFPSRVPKGARIQQLVSLREIPATVLDFLGQENQTVFPGKSLARYLNEPSNTTDPDDRLPILSELSEAPWLEPWYPISKGDIKSLMTEKYHYILNGDGSEELYDLKKDPNESHNLVKTAEAQKTLEKFRLALKDTTRFK